MDGFLLKKLLSMLVHLIPGALILLLLMLIGRRWFPRFCNLASISICCVLVAASVPPISNYFVAKLEDKFPVLAVAPPDTAMILVLGYGHMYAEGRPVNSVLMAGALSRVVEGVRLWKTQPDSYLAVSGARFRSPVSHAEVMQRMAIELGVPAERIILFDQTRDTEEEILSAIERISLVPSVGEKAREDGQDASEPEVTRRRLVVASSATHLPRAALMLDHHQATYSMAPTDYLTVDAPWFRPEGYFIRNMDRAVHEWVGMLWYTLRQYVQRS